MVCFVRHGTTATTGKVLPGRARGLHLSDQGREEAAKAGEALVGDDRVGGLRLAARAHAGDGLRPSPSGSASPSSPSAALSSAISVSWTGETLAQLRKLPEWQTVQRWPSGFRFPGGESFVELQSRLSDTVARICGAHPGEVVVAVSHADCIKVVLASVLGVPLDLFQRIVVAPCSISTVVYGSGGPAVLAMGVAGGPAGLTPNRERSS